MTKPARIKREEAVRVKLDPGVKARLQKLSELLGMPPSTLASLAIGVWVANQERTLTLQDKIQDRLADNLSTALSGDLVDDLKGRFAELIREHREE